MASTTPVNNTPETYGHRPKLSADAEVRSVEPAGSVGIPRRQEGGPTPVAFSQERLWLLEQIHPGDVSQNLSRGIRIIGSLDRGVLQRSLDHVVDRHGSLRTIFATAEVRATTDSKPRQLVAERLEVLIDVIELTGESLEVRARAEAQRPFDLTMGPLLRASLLKIEDRDHVLLLTLHRIIGDEHSMEVVFRDLWLCYRALGLQERPQLAELPIQFADYAAWQRNSLDEASFNEHSDYWRAKLKGGPAIINLATDRPRLPVQSWRGAVTRLMLTGDLLNEVKTLTQAYNATLGMTLLTVFQILLSRYTGQHDVVVGCTFPNRELEYTRNLIGPVSSILPLRTDLSGNPSFKELLARVKKLALEAESHKALPFEKLVEELQVERCLSHAPVFQVALNAREGYLSMPEIAGLHLQHFDFDPGTARFDLTLDITLMPDQLDCCFEYNSDLFDCETIERLKHHFRELLAEVVADPDQTISELPLITEDERRLMLVEWNQTRKTFDAAGNVQQLFEYQVSQTPDAVAVKFGETSLTYAELNRRANQVANYLTESGVGPDVVVGIFLDRSLEMAVGVLATLKAGGAYLPLDISYPPERLSFMVSDACVPVVITQERLLSRLPPCEAHIVCLDRDHSHISVRGAQNPPARATGENISYVIYTSGSTGQAKGVQLSQSSLVNLLTAMRERLSARDILLSVTTLSFDIASLEILLPLIVGAHLVIASKEDTVDGVRLRRLLNQSGATFMQATPATWQLLLESGWEGNKPFTIISGGEALTRELTEQLLARSTVLWNQYGPTETTIYSTASHISSVDEITIGRPIANTRVFILDAQLQPVPIGVPGELYIAGDGLARGYLYRPELTAERFIPNPFAEVPGERIYRTGDLVRYLRNGNIEYLGRLDHQVKLRGFRIELGEIESVLSQHENVRKAVVVAREDQPGNKQLVAYVIPESTSTSVGDLRKYLQKSLPEYMVPAAFVIREGLPLTPNGKIDRRALPAPSRVSEDSQKTRLTPRDNLELQLTNIWEKILGVDDINVRDDFFEVGGHSLLAARLFAQIQNRFGIHLPLATLFQSPTIEQLANVLRSYQPSESWSSLVEIQPHGSKPPLFCIHAAGANILIYRPLARHLGEDQPIYALQAQGLDGHKPPLRRVEDMAAHYIRQIRSVQPVGPYHLIGASFGGLVIFEMAHQLRAEGQTVALLAMLNTDCPVNTRTQRIKLHMAHLSRLGVRRYATEVVKSLRRRVVKSRASTGAYSSPDPEITKILEYRADADQALVQTLQGIIEAEHAYCPIGKMFPGRITFFWAMNYVPDGDDNRLGWRRLATAGLDVHEIPGNHTTIREEPNVRILVDRLKLCIERAAAQPTL